MTSADEREPWELEDEGAESEVPDYPTNAPIEEEERGELAAHEDAEEPFGAGEGEEDDTGPLDDEEPPPERTHEEEGAVGAGSQYAAEDAEDDHSEPQGPAGAA
ncbi:MAG: hypothetical protein LC713_04695 [Actinobacteria bacterium]|nr:hypothetical protein [Actinomycetota bacterium]